MVPILPSIIIGTNSNHQKESDDDSHEMKEIQIFSDNSNVNHIEILEIEEVKADNISNDKDAWWKHSTPGPSPKNEEWKKN